MTKRNAIAGLVLGLLAVGLAYGLSGYPETELGEIRRLGQLVGVAGVVLMTAAVVIGAPRAVGWAAVMLLVQYGTSLVSRATESPDRPYCL